jgi:hypothetical protein
VIDGVDVDVVDIEEQLATVRRATAATNSHSLMASSSKGHRRKRFRPGAFAERGLHGVDALADERQRFLGERQGQEIVEG